MRFNLQEKYYFIFVDYTGTTPRFGALYHPWEDQLHGLNIIELTCDEHHKVSGDWDAEKKYDGFIFKTEDGKRWLNQYPCASYGQLDTSADYYVRPDRGDLEEGDSPYNHKHTEVCSFLENVMRGIREMNNRIEKLSKGEKIVGGDSIEWVTKARDSLREFYNQVDAKLREQYKLKAVNIGWTAHYTDNREPQHMRDIPDVKLVPIDQEIEHINY